MNPFEQPAYRDPNEQPAHRRRRALSHVGGRIESEGDPREAPLLARALEVTASTDDYDDPARAHVHGFHTYPARMHPETASWLVRSFVPTRGRVLDPFCGSGTVLVEAQIQGCAAFGTDLNPVAVILSRCKTRPRSGAELSRLVSRARECAAYAEDRRRARAGATRRFAHEDIRLFEPHVLLELDSLRDKIESFGDDPDRGDLFLALSSVLVKLSKKRGDTSDMLDPRRTSPGFGTRMFLGRVEDLAHRLADLGAQLPSGSQKAWVTQDDATILRHVRGPVDAIITSPPYAATYDYITHHDIRLRWLGLDGTALAQGEIGSRNAYWHMPRREVREAWSHELGRFFEAAYRLLPSGGPLVLMMADSAVGDVVLRADEIVAQVGRACGFIPGARASQERPHFHGPTMAAFSDRPRAEHAILLRRN